VPIHNGKASTCFQGRRNGAHKARLIRNAMEPIRHQDEVHWPTHKIRHSICIAFDEVAVSKSRRGDSGARGIEHLRIPIDRNNMPYHLRQRRREEAVATTASHSSAVPPTRGQPPLRTGTTRLLGRDLFGYRRPP
jgi:hypothetical protein